MIYKVVKFINSFLKILNLNISKKTENKNARIFLDRVFWEKI